MIKSPDFSPPDRLPAGWFTTADIACYRRIYHDLVPAGGSTAEIGVYRGRSLMSVADIIREKRIRVFAVDTFAPYLEDTAADLYEQFIRTAMLYNVVPWIFPLPVESKRAARCLYSNALDFAFIDGDHTYEGVSRDIDLWQPLVKSGGWLGGHDLQEPGVGRAVEERFGDIQPQRGTMIWLVKQ